ncbi:MAG TPA: alpha/beta hydrolase [Candidatus Binatia bacterium]|jgi:pimeloyl-ACP methyl ester carboxylesterase
MRVIGVILLVIVAVIAAVPWIVGGESKTLDDDARRGAPGDFVRLEDGYTFYSLEGPAPAEVVVFVHGLNSPSYIWGDLVQMLRDNGYRTLVYDLYGRGWSDRPWTDYDLDLFDRQLGGLLRSLGLGGKVHLVGLSMGGIISSEFTLRHPDAVASLTMVDPGGFRIAVPGGSHLLTMPIVGDWLIQVIGERVLMAGQAAVVHDKSLVPGLLERFRPQLEFAGYKRAFLSTLRHVPLSDFTARYRELAASPVPIEIFWGRQDEVAPASGADVAATLIPKATIQLIDDAGHLSHYEKPKEVGQALLRFLADVHAPKQTGNAPKQAPSHIGNAPARGSDSGGSETD